MSTCASTSTSSRTPRRAGTWSSGPSCCSEAAYDDTIAYLVIDPTGSGDAVNIRTCPVGLLFLESGLPTSACTEQYAGQTRDLGTDLHLAR